MYINKADIWSNDEDTAWYTHTHTEGSFSHCFQLQLLVTACIGKEQTMDT